MKILIFEDLRSVKGIKYTRSHLRRMVARGAFPRPFRLGPGRVAWSEAEIDRYLEERAAMREAADVA